MRLPVKWDTRADAVARLLPKRSVGLELGVGAGESTGTFLTVVAPSRFVLVDMWSLDMYPEGAYYRSVKDQKKIEQERVDALKDLSARLSAGSVRSINYFELGVDEPPEGYYTNPANNNNRVDVFRYPTSVAAQFFPDDYFDWIHVDAGHRYDAALRDLMSYAPKLKVDGYMLCHDFFPYNDFDVDEAVLQLIMARPDFVTLGISGETYYPVAVLQRQALEL